MENIRSAGLDKALSPTVTGQQSYTARKRRLAAELDLLPIYAPRCVMVTPVKSDVHHDDKTAVVLPEGRVLCLTAKGVSYQGKKESKFWYLHHDIGIDQWTKRVAILSNLLGYTAEFGLNSKVLKALKRASVVGFTTKIENLKRISAYVFRQLKTLTDWRLKPRNQNYVPKGCRYPSLDRRRTCTFKGYDIPIWYWKKQRITLREMWD